MKKSQATPSRDLDEVDLQIIAGLRQDGRISFAQLAKQLDVSPGMVRQRYLQMVEDGVLHVVAVTNPTLLGYNMMALIGVEVDGNRLEEVAHEISAFEEATYVVVCTGIYDILVEVNCRDNAHLLQFLTQRLRAVEGVRHTQTFTYLQIVKEVYF